jgi:tetratricopeptide (TPR) repeat protein
MLVLCVAAFVVATGLAPVAAQDAPVSMQVVGEKLWAYQTGDARKALTPALDKAASDLAVATVLGRVLDQEKKYDDAVAQLKKAADLNPGDPEPQVWLGETLIHAKRAGSDDAFRKAADLAQAALKDTPGDARSLYFLGVAQQRLKQYDKAVETLGMALNAGSDNATTLYQIGATLAFQQKWGEAVAQLTAAIERNSGLAYAYYYRGLAQDKLGKKDQLVLDMERFLKLAPQSPDADKATAVIKAAKR